MTVLVIGATGDVGRHVVSGLVSHGASVRALARGSASFPSEVEVVRGDLTDPASLRPALSGVRSVFLLWPGFDATGASDVVDLLAGEPRHVVYLSAINVRDDSSDNGVWGQVEGLLERSGLAWTFLRAGGFATNTLMWAEQIRAEGVVRWPYGQAARSLIHERDIADVAVRALLEPGHVGAKYVLTGPESLTQAEQVRIIGSVVGTSARWEDMDLAAARSLLGDFADQALPYWSSLVTAPEPVTRTVAEVTGHPARTFTQWVREHVEDFRPLSTAEVADPEASAPPRALPQG
jgi:uncharacterized protein YbjT (DUF2867 family)